MPVDLTIPQIGESITTVFIAAWLKNPGDHVEAGEAVLEIDSDKASMEIPSPASGVLLEQLASEGDEVAVGAVVGRLEEGAAAAVSTPAELAAPAEPPGEVRAGPAARREATERGVDLDGVQGTGPRGRVTTDDVAAATATPAPAPAPAPTTTTAPAVGLVERVPMSPLRRTIARRLVESQATTATLTTFNEIDLTEVKRVRAAYQADFEKRHGVRLGFMGFFVKAVIEALKEYPALNAEIDGTDIVYKHYYNIGVAVSGPKGLVVPVVRDVDRLSFAGVEKAIRELGSRARDNKLALADFADGTFTVSNGGVFGSLMSTPVLNPPQVGILGMHAIQDRPVGVDGQIVLRPMMYVALSYDHRIVDGREAVSFLKRIKECVEAPERILLEV